MMQASTVRKAISKRLRPVLVVFTAFVLLAVILMRLEPGAESQLEALRSAGHPTTLAELDRWLAQVPASNNAALLIMEAADKRVPPSPTLEPMLPLLSPAGDLAEAKEEFETYIQRNAEALHLIHRAAALASARYPLNLSNSFTVQHLADVKALANLLKAETVYHSHRGSTDLAVRSVTSGFALGRTLREEPALISELVRVAIVAIGLSNLENLLAAHKLSPDHLASISRVLALAEADANEGAYHALVSERAIILHYLNNLPSGEFIQAFNPTGVGNPLAERLKVTAYLVLNVRGRDQRMFLEFMDELCRAATNSYPDALIIAGEIEREIDRRLASGFGRFAIVTPMLHSMLKVMEKEAALLTRIRCAQAALAVEQYRRAHREALPGSLAALVPTSFSEVPRDPAVGQPLQFEQTRDAYLVSSPAAAARLKNARTANFRIPK